MSKNVSVIPICVWEIVSTKLIDIREWKYFLINTLGFSTRNENTACSFTKYIINCLDSLRLSDAYMH